MKGKCHSERSEGISRAQKCPEWKADSGNMMLRPECSVGNSSQEITTPARGGLARKRARFCVMTQSVRFILVFILLCVTAGTAQLIRDTVIRFPEPIINFIHIPGGNKLYVTPASLHPWILDCATLEFRNILPFKTGGPDRYSAVWCSRQNKVYIPLLAVVGDTYILDTLAIVDNVTDSVLRYLLVDGWSGMGMAYNPVQDRVYFPCGLDNTIKSLDCTADTIFKTIPTPDCSPAFFAVWDSAGDKMYFGSSGWGNRGGVPVVDCRTDSLVKVIYSGIGNPGTAVYNHLFRKLYVGGCYMGMGGWGVSVIDCAMDRVIKKFESIPATPGPLPLRPQYCSVENKVYWIHGDWCEVGVIDCKIDSILRWLPETIGTLDCGYAPWSNRLYVVADTYPGPGRLVVYDCRNDSFIGSVQFGQDPLLVLCNPIDHKIYVITPLDSAIYVFREDLHPVEERTTLNASRLTPNATIVRGVLRWETDDRGWKMASGLRSSVFLLDVAGRKVLELVPGANDVRHLPPGVYFICPASSVKRPASNIQKVVITK